MLGLLLTIMDQVRTEDALRAIVETLPSFSILGRHRGGCQDAIQTYRRAASLLGSRCLVSGISPTVAHTMVDVAVSEEGFLTFGLLQDALRFALRSSGVLQGESA